MAATVSNPAEASAKRIPPGVQPLRAGQGHSFFWRRLHSLSGIFPIGAFLVEHFVSNSLATNGGTAYNENVRFLTGLPFVLWLEIFFIYIPIAYHAGYGLFIWWRGDANNREYPFAGNWMYWIQRWTGILALVYMAYHTYTMRFSGAHIMTHSEIAFAKVWVELQNPWLVAFYFVGLACASWHFAYGIWLFAAKWGITVGDNARRKFGYVCLAIGLVMGALSAGSLFAFVTTPRDKVVNLDKYEQLQHEPGPQNPQ
ncbi:MAG TPA: succinate dehydrogenase [Terriglobales bacterium]|nr:succinate dehydrogenase [Terriglobales bacterium]